LWSLNIEISLYLKLLTN